MGTSGLYEQRHGEVGVWEGRSRRDTIHSLIDIGVRSPRGATTVRRACDEKEGRASLRLAMITAPYGVLFLYA